MNVSNLPARILTSSVVTYTTLSRSVHATASYYPRTITYEIFFAKAGAYPEWELGVQTVPEAHEHDFDFDLLDSTKIIPEELVPVKYIGTMTLNSNPTEFFSETEQIAFCTQHMIPGIEHSK